MAYRGSEAVRLADVERERELERAPRFGVVEGDGIDAKVRRGVSRDFMAIVGSIVSGIALFVALGACRVLITTQTVNCLSANMALRSDIEEAELVNSDLRIERSVLSSSSRICRIAEQNYGMVRATTRDAISLAPEKPQAEVQPEASEEGSAELLMASEQAETSVTISTATTGNIAPEQEISETAAPQQDEANASVQA